MNPTCASLVSRAVLAAVLAAGCVSTSSSTTAGGLIWVASRDFADREAFETFADHVHDLWSARRPTGKAFEVIMPSSE